jgi:glycosyltransferase involved in cell wall biosynthesis/organic radical activating enzyme
MKFSIIVPAFNTQEFISRCLMSLKNQTYSSSDFEVIIIDDYSTDETVNRVLYFCENFPNFKLITCKQNSGPGIARNTGLNLANGEWIIFLDSDDELFPDCLSSLHSFIEKNARNDLELIGFDWTSELTDSYLKSSKRIGRRDGHFLENRSEMIRQYLSHRMDGSVIYNTYKKTLIDNFRIRFASGFHEDVDFAFKCYFFASKTIYFSKKLYRKNNRKSSIINSVSSSHIEGYFRAWMSIRNLIESCNIDLGTKQEYKEYYHYGSVGTIATRVREVTRHCSDLKTMSNLFSLIYQYVDHLFDKNIDIEKYLDNYKTVYFLITQIFLQTMKSSELNEIEKATLIVDGVKEKSGKSWSCVDLHHSLFLRPDQVRTCCKRFFVDGEMRGDVVLFDVQGEANHPIATRSILSAKRDLYQKINSGESTPCDSCPFLEFREWPPLNELEIKYLSLEHHSVCNLHCTYCSEDYYGGRIVSYDLKETLNMLLKGGYMNNCNLVVWGGGEPTLGNDFDNLLKKISDEIPHAQQRILTNSVKSSQMINDLLRQNKAQIVTSIDAGTEETFKQVRGRAKLSQVCNNLVGYSQTNNHRVTIKYIFTEGNESLDEVIKFIELIKQFSLTKCNFQISGDFKKESIDTDIMISMLVMFGLLKKEGAEVVYFDELIRHRLSLLVEMEYDKQIKKVHEIVGVNFIAIPEDCPNIVIWGAGQQAKYLMEKSTFLKRSNVIFFVDSTPEKIGTEFFGKIVHHPSILIENEFRVAIAAVQGYPLILEQYKSLNINESRLINELII